MTRFCNTNVNVYVVNIVRPVVVRKDANDDQGNGSITDADPVPTGSGGSGDTAPWSGYA